MSEPLRTNRTSDAQQPSHVGTAARSPHFRRPATAECRNRCARAALPTPEAPGMSEPLRTNRTSDIRSPGNVGTAARHLHFRRPAALPCRNRRAPATLPPGGSCFLCEGLSEGCRSSSKSGQTRAKNDALPSKFVPRPNSINWQRKEPKHQLIARQVSGICQLPAETCFTDSAIIECPWS